VDADLRRFTRIEQKVPSFPRKRESNFFEFYDTKQNQEWIPACAGMTSIG
jgi:hypothetical protein